MTTLFKTMQELEQHFAERRKKLDDDERAARVALEQAPRCAECGQPLPQEESPTCTECGQPLSQADIDAGETVCANCADDEFMAEVDTEEPLLGTLRVKLRKKENNPDNSD